MTRFDRTSPSTPRPGATALTIALRAWLLAGLALCLLLPPLRGSSPTLGWLPIWLVVTPLVGTLGLARNPWREARAFARVWHPHRQATAQALRVRR